MVLFTKIGNARRKFRSGEIVLSYCCLPDIWGEMYREQLAVWTKTKEEVLDLILGLEVVRI